MFKIPYLEVYIVVEVNLKMLHQMMRSLAIGKVSLFLLLQKQKVLELIAYMNHFEKITSKLIKKY